MNNSLSKLCDYSKVSIKRPVLLNDLVWIFPKSLWPGPLIVLFYFRAATANFWSLLNNLVWVFLKKSIKRPNSIIETLEYLLWNLHPVKHMFLRSSFLFLVTKALQVALQLFLLARPTRLSNKKYVLKSNIKKVEKETFLSS